MICERFFRKARMRVLECVHFKEQPLVSAAQHDDVALSQGDTRARHDAARHVRAAAPRVRAAARVVSGRREFVDIRQEFRIPFLIHAPPAEQVEAVADAVALRHGNRKGPGRSRPRGQLLPDGIAAFQTREVKRPEITLGRLQAQFRGSPGQIDRVPDNRRA